MAAVHAGCQPLWPANRTTAGTVVPLLQNILQIYSAVKNKNGLTNRVYCDHYEARMIAAAGGGCRWRSTREPCLWPACPRAGWRYNPAFTAARPGAPDGGPVAPTACVVMIDGWLTHRVALTVAKLPGPRWKG
jgi:hypothetical protein